MLLPNNQVSKQVKRRLLSSKAELLFQVSRSPSKILFKKDYSGGLYVLINVTVFPFFFHKSLELPMTFSHIKSSAETLNTAFLLAQRNVLILNSLITSSVRRFLCRVKTVGGPRLRYQLFWMSRDPETKKKALAIFSAWSKMPGKWCWLDITV